MRRVGLALVLVLVSVAAFAGGRVYDRREWLPRWADADHNCKDTRQEVLIRDHRSGVDGGETLTLVLSDDGCRVVSGRWIDPYAGRDPLVTDPAALDIDHVVPLGYAARHGGAAWTLEQKRAYANWLGYRGALLAVGASANRQKGDKGPGTWVPENVASWCPYAERWSAILVAWDLRPDEPDRVAIKKMLETC